MAQAQPRFRIRYEVPKDSNRYAYFYADTFDEARAKFFNKFTGDSYIVDVSIVEDEDYPEPAINLLGTNDAMVWAKEFVRIKERMDWNAEDIDESLMVGWFANAMAAQEFVDDRRRKEQPADEPCATSVGWAWAEACSLMDQGVDVRNITAPEFWERAQQDFRDDLQKQDNITGSW